MVVLHAELLTSWTLFDADVEWLMVRKRSGRPPVNGTAGSLEQAMALLIQNQASFLSTFLSQMTQTHERFVRIDRELEQIKAILLRHGQLLNDLPEAIRQKIGFKSGPGSPRSHST
jgi:hypothetical protein